MMSKKQWSAMLCLHVSYLFLGASIFYHIENPLELEDRAKVRRERFEILRLVHKHYAPTEPEAQSDFIGKLSDYCQRIMTNTSDSEEPAPVWDFYHSFFFSYTVVSTIGYGNLAPSTSFGRILMIFYGIVGIPINGILFANLGAYFGTTFKGLYQKYKLKNPKSGSNIDYQIHRFGLFGQITMYLLPGCLIFIFLPACLFVFFEGWDYALAVYYAFVTLTTIGFGDYVAGITDLGYGVYFIIYKIFLIFWITFGLGYLVMVVGFLTQGLKSKRMLQLEHMVAQNLKQTQSKIWNNVTKDVGYLRRMLNEIYMMRFKPIYHDEVITPRFHRSSSCPSLIIIKDESPKTPRRRANSEAMPYIPPELQRVQSESDLLAIDRNKTFSVSAIVQPAELLAKVVDALGSLQNEDTIILEEGVHGFSDEEILSSERMGSNWSMGGDRVFATPPRVPRARAASEIRVSSLDRPDRFHNNNEWTWTSSASSGKLRDIAMARRLGKLSVPNVSISMKSNIDTVDSEQEKSFISKFNPFKKSPPKRDDSKRYDSDDNMTPAEYLKKTTRGRISLAPMPQQKYINKTKKGRASMASLPPNNDILEETTIGDLIRALTALHTSETNLPQRKMGTASFTPPSSTLNVNGGTARRFSVHPAIVTPNLERRQSNSSVHLPPAAARRRFSLHPTSSHSPTFTRTISPLVSGGTSQPRRGSLILPPPYSQFEPPSSSTLGRRRLSSTGTRRFPQPSSSGTPHLRTRRPLFPQSILEGETATSRIRHGSLSDVRIDRITSKKA